MKKTNRLKAALPVAVGLLLLVLRVVQNKKFFDPETGLSLPGLPGTALAVGVVLTLVVSFVLALRLPKARLSFQDHFAAPGQGELILLVMGSFLLAAGGILSAIPALGAEGGMAVLVTGVLALCAGGGLLLLTKQLRSGGAPTVAPLLPALFFGVFFVLAVYLPVTDDPVLTRYYLPVLAAAMATYAFAQLAGFLRSESSSRSFTPTASCASTLCTAAIADGGLGQKLLFAGCALALTAFLLLQREETA